MFRLPNGRPPLLQIHDIPVGRHRISTMTMGRGPTLLPTARRHSRIVVRDSGDAEPALPRPRPRPPGFLSCRRLALNARWSADIMLGLMISSIPGHTWSATRSVGGSRSSSDSTRPSAPARLACFAPRLHGCAARFTRLCACCARSSGCCRMASAAR
jgi:hypothetical protein